MKVYDIRERQEFIEEVAILTQREWGAKDFSQEEFDEKVLKKIKKIKDNLDNPFYAKLVLVNENELIGFISMFPSDGDERCDLTPWYATMYVKSMYRKKGYSKILNDAILKEAKKRGFKKIYLKSDLKNYYEKFGAIYMEKLQNGENLYYIDLTK